MYCQIFIPNHSPHCHMVSQWPTNRAWLRKLYDPLSLQNETTLNYTVATQFCFFLASMFLDYINILLKKSNVNAEKYFFFWKIFLYSDVLLPFSDLVIASSAIYLQLSWICYFRWFQYLSWGLLLWEVRYLPLSVSFLIF